MLANKKLEKLLILTCLINLLALDCLIQAQSTYPPRVGLDRFAEEPSSTLEPDIIQDETTVISVREKSGKQVNRDGEQSSKKLGGEEKQIRPPKKGWLPFKIKNKPTLPSCSASGGSNSDVVSPQVIDVCHVKKLAPGQSLSAAYVRIEQELARANSWLMGERKLFDNLQSGMDLFHLFQELPINNNNMHVLPPFFNLLNLCYQKMDL